MRSVTAADVYEEFWDLYESGYDTGVKLEQIIEDLGYGDFYPEHGYITATDEQYREVLDIYYDSGKENYSCTEFQELVK